jgi:class 3 adenylate cyclase
VAEQDLLPAAGPDGRPSWRARFQGIGLLPTDDADTVVVKRAVTRMASVVVVASLAWTASGLVMGSAPVAVSSLVFAIVVAGLIADFARRRDFRQFIAVMLATGLGIVLIGYLLLGGSLAGGSDLAWGILAPIGAVVVYGARGSIPWFVAYGAMIALAVIADPFVRRFGTPPPYPFSLGLIAFNVVGPAAVLYVLLRYVDGQRAAARQQSERLLLNILPASVADRLKAGEEQIAEQYPEASVLFADVVDFTPLAERTPPRAVVEMLTALFTRFDELADEHGLEKIKTVGDAYMAAAGVPEPRPDHAEAAVEMAIAMQRALAAWNASSGHRLRLRVGIATGPVIAGVIGRRKFAYDLWGDTVNTASRMESTGEPGCVQVTEATYARLEGRFPFVRRDAVAVKGKAPMTTYLLDAAGL